MPLGPLAQLAPRNEALARAKAREEYLASVKPGFMQRLLGGADDPRLSGGQNREAANQAITRGGFAGLMAAGKGENLITTVGTIGTEASEFREKHNEQIGLANLELSPALDLQSQIVELVRDGQKHRVLINKRTGVEIADLGVSDFAPSDKDLGTPFKVKLASGDEAFAVFDKERGILVDFQGNEIRGAIPIPPKPRVLLGHRADLATGIKYEFLQDEFGNVIREYVSGRVDDGDDEASAVDRRFARSIHRDVNVMENMLLSNGEGELKAFHSIETLAAQAGSGGGLFAPLGTIFKELFSKADVQIFNAAAQNVLSNIIKSRSGAQASNQEVERLRQFATPLPGDEQATVAFKLQMLRDIANDLEFGRDPFDRVRDESERDGLRKLPFDENGRMLRPSGVGGPEDTDNPFKDVKRGG